MTNLSLFIQEETLKKIMLKTRHFHFAVIFLILINTHLSEAHLCDYYDTNCGWNITFIIFGMIMAMALFMFLCCLCVDCCMCCNESFVTTDDFDIETTTQDEPPPFYLRNETVNMNQVQDQTTYNFETLPQSLPDFGLPKRPTIRNNQHNGMTLSPTTLPSAPQAYSENSNRTCQRHANCQNSPQPLPRFHRPPRISGSTNQNNVHNNMTLSPTSILSSTSPLDSDPPPYSEISNGEWINGTWVHHSNSETLPQPLPGASERFSGPESEATYSTQNETTTSPNPILYSYSS